MRATTEGLANVVNISSNIETFTAQNTKVDFGQRDPIDCVPIDVHQARIALDYFSLASELVERHATVLFRRDHWRQLIKIAPELFKCCANLILIQRGDWPLLNHFALSILRVGRHAEHKRTGVLLVFAHQQILDVCATPNREQQ